MHYYQHHIGDFMRDTANLNDHQLATYLRMLWAYYDTEAPIKGEFEDVAFAMRSDEKTVRLLLRHYFKETPEGWRHTRCDKEVAEYHSKAEKARNSANARWKNADAMRTHSDRTATASVSDANQEPITNNQNKEKEKTATRKRAAPFPIPDGVDPQVWADWLLVRKGKKAPTTETAMEGVRREAEKAGLTFPEAVAIACREGWAGFKAKWYANLEADARQSPGQRPAAAEPAWRTEQRNRIAQAAPGLLADAPNQQNFIDVESRNVPAFALG